MMYFVGEMYFVAMILRNAYVCMNGCETSDYFDILPPEFEDWIEEGPLASRYPIFAQ